MTCYSSEKTCARAASHAQESAKHLSSDTHVLNGPGRRHHQSRDRLHGEENPDRRKQSWRHRWSPRSLCTSRSGDRRTADACRWQGSSSRSSDRTARALTKGEEVLWLAATIRSG